ncbi:MAG: hypothetical protein WBH47_15555 [Streptosporangiaceae bacterium]
MLDCDAGGVPWPQIIAFYAPGPRLLASDNVLNFDIPKNDDQQNSEVWKIIYRNRAIDIEWSAQQTGDPAAIDSMDYSALLRLIGHKIVASNIVATTERQAASTFIADLRRGDRLSARQFATPGLIGRILSQLHQYPSALSATLKCYGMGDAFTLPAQLGGVDAAGPDHLDPDASRLCALAIAKPGGHWLAFGLQHLGFRSWLVVWSQVV